MSLAQQPLDWPSNEAKSTVSDQAAFETLSNERRRYVIQQLLEEDKMDLRSLSRQVAARENEKPAARVSRAERHRVYNSLQQFHLPKLDDLGVVEYDSGRGCVEPTAALDRLGMHLNAVERRRHLWVVTVLNVAAGIGLVVTTLLASALLSRSYGLALGALVAATIVALLAVGWRHCGH